ncbi:hypothetical protein KKC67_03505 [Patescibacteria group bacterium]|nr:hypothetical protein [Patescibacteria group bacterium]MBU1992046.1 hypothetical protein [Patescibacteria group bacterium]
MIDGEIDIVMDTGMLDDMDFLCDDNDHKKVKSVMLRMQNKHKFRRAFGEKKLYELFDGNTFDEGDSYHVLSGGDIDSLSFLSLMLKQQSLEYCLFSTWCMKLHDVLQVEKWVNEGKIKRVDAYVGEIFSHSYVKEYAKLREVAKKCGGRVCVFRNHAKIFAGTGTLFDFGIASSANIDTNPRTENTVITIGNNIYEFYKEFFDGIKSFSRDFDDWTKYKD